GNRRLIDGRLVEVLDRLDLRLRELTLKSSVRLLYPGDEGGNLVVIRRCFGRDLLALTVEAADETNLLQQLVCRIGDEVVNAVFLTDLSSEHFYPSRDRRLWCRILRILASLRRGLEFLPRRRGGPVGQGVNWSILRENAPGRSQCPGLVSHVL